MKIPNLTHTEEQFMMLFWRLNSFYSKDILLQHPEPKPHQNTVSTYLKILQEKGFLTVQKEGRIFHYSIGITKELYRETLVRNLVSTYYDANSELFLKELLDKKITELPLENPQENTLKKSDIQVLIDDLMKPKKKEKRKKKKEKKGKKKG